MARKTRAEAEAETQRAHEARLQYLSRNPGFQRVIECLMTLRDALPGKPDALTLERVEALGKFIPDLQASAATWGVSWVLLSQLSWREWQAGLAPKDRIPAASPLLDSPVMAWTDGAGDDVARALGIDDTPAPSAERSRYLNLRVDLDHPADTLLPLIGKELGRHAREHRRARRRLDTVDFNLRVFDLAEAGETFRAIARTLKKRRTTVKSAWLVARRNIYGPGGPSKAALPLEDFDPETHFQTCPICSKIERAGDPMCPAAESYANQDHRGQRELTGLDPDRASAD